MSIEVLQVAKFGDPWLKGQKIIHSWRVMECVAPRLNLIHIATYALAGYSFSPPLVSTDRTSKGKKYLLALNIKWHNSIILLPPCTEENNEKGKKTRSTYWLFCNSKIEIPSN